MQQRRRRAHKNKSEYGLRGAVFELGTAKRIEVRDELRLTHRGNFETVADLGAGAINCVWRKL
jgi:hypothetical protein